MGGILDKLDEWLRGLLIEGITGNLSGMFDTVNTKVGEIAGEVGQTPLAWNSGVFSMIRSHEWDRVCSGKKENRCICGLPGEFDLFP